MHPSRFLAVLHSLIASVASAFASFLVGLFAIPADLLAHVRMCVADYAAKLGRDLIARRRMFALAMFQDGPGPAYA